ncbi:hypothetical protein [Tenacibaculum aquimarinum]|uniref:hypothetical protein n=1 Tax=Tenacibaculum aquimarinum TaxID=2910675 RepID=UPI001F0A5847|nr:hypothetical protein [Tenacibaculum aquimarinum]MCH3884532.1 hypothetical protein [Tenacibaculum aquimarinum]
MAIQINIENRIFLVPEADDPCDFWTSYFAKLKRELGQENAKMIWLITWKSNGSASCTTSPNFNKWLHKNNLDVSNMATRTIADISEMGGNIFGLGKNLTKILSIGVPVILAVVLVGIIVLLRNSSKNADLSDVAMLTPAGRGLKLLGK